jgi:hypothetical protein
MKSCWSKRALRTLLCKIHVMRALIQLAARPHRSARRNQACFRQGHARFEALAAKTNK